jgi:hypothetical protein
VCFCASDIETVALERRRVSESKEGHRMDAAKLTPDLAAQLAQADADDVLEVILELEPKSEPPAAAPQSREEQIALRKEAFNHYVAPVEEAIHEAGGEVDPDGRAWINQTVKARVPAKGIEQLSELEKVAALDVPHRLEPDFG